MRAFLVFALAFLGLACDKTIKEVRTQPQPSLQPPPALAQAR